MKTAALVLSGARAQRERPHCLKALRRGGARSPDEPGVERVQHRHCGAATASAVRLASAAQRSTHPPAAARARARGCRARRPPGSQSCSAARLPARPAPPEMRPPARTRTAAAACPETGRTTAAPLTELQRTASRRSRTGWTETPQAARAASWPREGGELWGRAAQKLGRFSAPSEQPAKGWGRGSPAPAPPTQSGRCSWRTHQFAPRAKKKHRCASRFQAPADVAAPPATRSALPYGISMRWRDF